MKKVVLMLVLLCLVGCIENARTELEMESASYDPNDPLYKFIPPAPQDWIDIGGDTERTRIIHRISELSVVMSAQSKKILELESEIDELKDPND
jgi:hypothetical protein